MPFFFRGKSFAWEQRSEGTCPVVSSHEKTHKEFTWFCRFRHPSTPHFEAKILLETADLTNFVGKFEYINYLQTRTEPIEKTGNHTSFPWFHNHFTFALSNQGNQPPRSGDV